MPLGTSASGFAAEVAAEENLATLDYLEDLYRDWDDGARSGGGAAARIDAEFSRIRSDLGDLPGITADPPRLRAMLAHLTRTLHPGVLNDCFYNHATAACAKAAGHARQPLPMISDTGLRGFTAGGLPDDSWENMNEDRDVAFADGLYGSGMRRGEWSSVLTVEVPEPGGRRWHRCWLAGACAKGKRGRPYWLPADAARKTWFYLREGSRAAAVARAQRDGRYERVADRWVLEAAHGDGVLAFRDQAGGRRLVRLDALTPRRRMKLFMQGEAGLEPLWLWLNQDGTPRPKDSWNRLFDRANARALRVLGADATGRPRLFARPHMLRHSCALRW